MFTGIIQSVGKVISKQSSGGDLRFIIHTKFSDMADVALGDSIACDGVCLTVCEMNGENITIDVSVETLSKTTLINWQIDTEVNLEKSLCLKDKLGGHMVSGHVDAVAECLRGDSSARSMVYQFNIPADLDKYIVRKGSVAINGVSLTVNKIDACVMSVNLIPHTLEHSNLGSLNMGDKVNIEIDTIARYVEKMVKNS